MVAKKNRLNAADILTVRHTALTLPAFRIKVRASSLPYNRFGVVAAAAVGTSVARHRLKRMILDAAGTWEPLHKDIVFILLKRIREISPQQILRELQEAHECIKAL